MNPRPALDVARRVQALLVLAAVAIVASLPGQPVAADVAADLRRLASCDAARQRELAAIVRASFALPDDVDVRVLTCQGPEGEQPVVRKQLLLTVEVVVGRAPALTFRLLGDLDPESTVRFGWRERSWDGNAQPRTAAARLVQQMRSLTRRRSAGLPAVVGCAGLSSSNGRTARYTVRVPVGAAHVEAGIDLPLVLSTGDPLATIDALAEDLRIALEPLLVIPGPCTAWLRQSELHVGWQELSVTAEVTAQRCVYRVAGVELSQNALLALGEAAHRQLRLARDLGSDPFRLRAFVPGHGFLLMLCPRRPPAALTAEGSGTWLGANAQAILLSPGPREARADRLETVGLALRVRPAAWPRPFVIEVPQLGISAVWGNPQQPPKLSGAEVVRF